MVVKKRTTKIANRLRVMSHPARLQILEELLDSKDGYNVNTIQKLLKLSQSSISQHLTALKMNDILDSRRNGVEMFYYVKNDVTKVQIQNILAK